MRNILSILVFFVCVTVFSSMATEPFIGVRGNISTGGSFWSTQNYGQVTSVLKKYNIPQDAQWSAVLSARGEIDVIFIHINGEIQSLVNNRGQWQHNFNVDASAWRLHIHHAELRASVMNPDLGLNRYIIMGGIGSKQLVFGQVTMSGSVGVMFLTYDISADDLGSSDTYSINNAESLYAGLNLRYNSQRIDIRGKFAIFGTPTFNGDYTFMDYLQERNLDNFYLGTEVGYMGQFNVFINARKKDKKLAIGPYIDVRFMETRFQTEFFAGIGVRIQRNR